MTMESTMLLFVDSAYLLASRLNPRFELVTESGLVQYDVYDDGHYYGNVKSAVHRGHIHRPGRAHGIVKYLVQSRFGKTADSATLMEGLSWNRIPWFHQIVARYIPI